jgi:hypothetical protein
MDIRNKRQRGENSEGGNAKEYVELAMYDILVAARGLKAFLFYFQTQASAW